jgi:hypothetical protein
MVTKDADSGGKKRGRYRLPSTSLELLPSPEEIDLLTFVKLQNRMFFDMEIFGFRVGFHCFFSSRSVPSNQWRH